MKRTTLVERYMAEQFNFGGELKTRAEIIAYLKSIGGTSRQIDLYLCGLDFSRREGLNHVAHRAD